MTSFTFVIQVNCVYPKLNGPSAFESDRDKKLERLDKITSFLKYNI